MIKLIYGAILSILLIPSTVFAKQLNVDEIMQGTVRVTATRPSSNGMQTVYGTGTFIHQTDDNYYILTNGHVAANASNILVELFNEGFKSPRLQAKLSWSYYISNTSIDMALIEVSKDLLSGYKPTIIPLAHPKHKVKENEHLYGAGCPEGRWLQYWQARLLRMENNRIFFNMPPVGGQSGSAVLSNVNINGEDFTRIVGLLTWRFGNNGVDYGGGLSISRIWDVLDGDAQADTSQGQYVAQYVSDLNKLCKHCRQPRDKHLIIVDKNKESMVDFDLYCPIDRVKLNQKVAGTSNLVIEYSGWGTPPNIFNGRPPGNNGPGRPPIFPPNDGEDTPPSEDVEGLKAKLAELEKLIEQMKNSNAGLEGELDNLSKEKERIEQILKEVDLAKGQLEYDNGLLNIKVGKLTEENSGLKAKIKELLNKVSTPWGPLGNVFGAILAALASGSLGALIWHKGIFPFIISKTGRLPAAIIKRILQHKFENKVDKSIGSLYNIIAGNSEKKNESVAATVEHVIQNVVPASKPDVVQKMEFNYFEGNKAQNEYFADFFRQNKDSVDGRGALDWAFRCSLYREAIERLKSGDLKYRDGVLHGSKHVATAIERWVDEEFYRVREVEELENDVTYAKAYMGWLYYRAVQKLKEGYFKVLGHAEVADVIEQWVHKTFRQRLENVFNEEDLENE